MSILSLIWPWAEIYRLRRQLVAAQKQVQALQSALNEADPFYYARKWGELAASSPRMNCRIMGI